MDSLHKARNTETKVGDCPELSPTEPLGEDEMDNKAPAFQFYPKQFIGDDKVLAMDWDVRGMHVWLMCISWQQPERGTLPNDPKLIRKWLGNPENFEQAFEQLRRVWYVDEKTGLLNNDGLRRASERQIVLSESRKKGADTRNSQKPHKNVTSPSQEPHKSLEDEHEYSTRVLDSNEEVLVKIVQSYHPLRKLRSNEIPYGVTTAVIEAIESECELDLDARPAKAIWIMERTFRISEIMRKEGRANFLPNAMKFFGERMYRRDDEDWRTSTDKPAQTHPGAMVGMNRNAPRAISAEEQIEIDRINAEANALVDKWAKVIP